MTRVVTAVAADDPGMTLEQAVWLLRPDNARACACFGPSRGESLCPCALGVREARQLKRAAHIVARLLDDARRLPGAGTEKGSAAEAGTESP
jgi:hypothetical protein